MEAVELRALRSFSILFMEHQKVVLILVLVTLASIIPVGYHIIVLNVPEKIVKTAIQEQLKRDYGSELDNSSMNFLWAFIVACQSIGALFGCVALIPFIKSFGVKNSLLMANNTLLLVGSLFMYLSYYIQTMILLIVGRILIGIYTGLATGLLPIYIQELAPTQIKGSLSSFIHIAVLFGGAISALFSLDIFWGNSRSWHLLLTAPVACVVFQSLYAKYLPDTPGYYLSIGKSFDAAESIRYYYDLELYDDPETVQQYRRLVRKMPEQRSFANAIRNKAARKGIALGALVSAAQILSGTMSVANYSSSMFSSISLMNSLVDLFPMLGAIFSIFLSLPAIKLVETCGRRPLLIVTLIICATANFLLCICSLSVQYFHLNSTYFGVLSQSVITFAFLLLGIGYNLGVGPVAYFLCIELVDAHFVSVALTCSIAINWITNTITTLVYYPLNETVGGYSYLLFTVPITISVFILNKYLPETKYNSKTESAQLRLSCNAIHGDDENSGQPRPYGTFTI